MKDRFKNYEQGERMANTNRIENEHERPRPSENDLRHFITSHRHTEQLGKSYGPGRTTGRVSDLSSKGMHIVRGNCEKEMKTSGTRTPPEDYISRDPTGKYARYSPETEWLLLRRDKERAKDMDKQSRSPSPTVDSKDRFKRLVEEKLRGLEDFVRGSSRQDRDQDEKSSQSSRHRFSREREKDSDRDYLRDRGLLKRKLRNTSPLNRKMEKDR